MFRPRRKFVTRSRLHRRIVGLPGNEEIRDPGAQDIQTGLTEDVNEGWQEDDDDYEGDGGDELSEYPEIVSTVEGPNGLDLGEVADATREEDELLALDLVMDRQELEQLDEFQDPEDDWEVIDNIPTVPFSYEDTEGESTSPTETVTSGATGVAPTLVVNPAKTVLSTRSLRAIAEDDSKVIHHLHFHDVNRNPVEMALGIYAEKSGTSVAEWKVLRQILGMVDHPLLNNLPQSLGYLKKHVKSELPLLDMRVKSIPLIPEKIATDTAQRKAAGQSENIPHEDLYFFDAEKLFTAFMSSDLAKKMHAGMGEYVDEPCELWHAKCWTASIRTTSGEYAHFQNRNAVFPSDWVEFKCGNLDCEYCKEGRKNHMGRVLSVARDNRSTTTEKGAITLEIMEAFGYDHIMEFIPSATPAKNEVLLSEEHIFYITESLLTGGAPLKVHLDRVTLEDHAKVRDPLFQRELQSFSCPEDEIFVRQVVNNIESDRSQMRFRAINRYHPIRAELELETFGRARFEEKWDVTRGNRCVSVPLLTFIDGFGLYRNSYRSIMGFYLNFAALTARERERRANVIPFTLGPHGSNFDDVVDALKSLTPLDEGVVLTLDGQETLMCVFSLCYTADMPQGQYNSGNKSQNAARGCRFCFVETDERGNLQFNFDADGRYHYQTKMMRDGLNSMSTKTARERFCTTWGMDPDIVEPALNKISPALDIVLTRPADPAHSEYGGITRLMHEMLKDMILTPSAAKLYAAELRKFPFPAGYGRLQSPIHYLKSYSLSDHARWSIIIPLLLRGWLSELHFKRRFLQSAIKRCSQTGSKYTDPVSYVVSSYAAVAKSNSILMGDHLSVEDRQSFVNIIIRARTQFQELCEDSAESIKSNSSFRAQPTSRRGSLQGTPVLQPDINLNLTTKQLEAVAMEKKRETLFRNMAKRPNVHVGLHYKDIMDEFGLPFLVNVLIGEDKHRFFKKIVYNTNHTRVEKALLEKENVRQTIRLILLHAFIDTDPELTKLVDGLMERVPALFEDFMPRSEFAAHTGMGEEVGEESVDIRADTQHQRPRAINRQDPKAVLKELGLPTKQTQIQWDASFSAALTSAYRQGYNENNVLEFGGKALQWVKKLSFYDPVSEHKLVFAVGHYLALTSGDGILRISGIFVHELTGSRRLFVRGDEFKLSGLRDAVLDLPLLHQTRQNILITLPEIAARQLYVVSVAGSLVLVDWVVRYLIKHNQQIPHNHFRKDWQRRVRCHFDQPGRKLRRRNARLSKSAAVAPRPIDKLRPIVRCPTIKYNRRVRAGRGFTLAELKEAGIPRKLAPTIGISVDPRRQNLSVESLSANVARLKEYRARLILFPRKLGQQKTGDATKEELKAVTENFSKTVSTALPIVHANKEIQYIKKSDLPAAIEGGAYKKLREARSGARFAGVRAKRASEKAAEAEASKK